MGYLKDACNLLKFVAAGTVGAGAMKLGEFYTPRMALDVYIHPVKEEEGCAQSPAKIFKKVMGGDP